MLNSRTLNEKPTVVNYAYNNRPNVRLKGFLEKLSKQISGTLESNYFKRQTKKVRSLEKILHTKES